MSFKTISKIDGVDVLWDGRVIKWTAGMQIDADGSPHAYHPQNIGLDHIRNAGSPGNWYGVVTDSQGEPVVQGPNDPAPGYYVSPTTYQHRQFKARDPRRYADSEKVPYVVVPGKIRKGVPPIVIGCRATVKNLRTGKEVVAVVADSGPSNKIGEGSIALAKALGINANARTGGTDERIIEYRLYPGEAAQGYELQGV